MLRPSRARRAGAREHLASTTAIAASFLLVFVAAFALTLNLRRLRDGFSWVDHTDRVLLEASLIETELVESNGAARTFAVTGQNSALERATSEFAQLPHEIEMLRGLCVDNLPQAHRVDELGALIARRIALEQNDVRARVADPNRRDPLIDGPAAEQLADAIRLRLHEFRSTEIALLTERQHQAARDATITTALATVTMLLALLSGGLGIALMQRERQRHRLRELETELIHVSRMNTVGQTASVLAHEVNQPLTATRNYLNGARRLLKPLAEPEANRASEALSLAQVQIERASQIIARLRRHVQGDGPDRSVAAPGMLIEDAVLLSGLRSGGEVELHTEIERNLPDVFVDSVQVQQVVINLIRNATEAMAGCPKRELHISAVRDRDSVRVAVRDTGTGLAPELAARLFRPLTTTKPEGMGVGLSISRSIINAHGGRIWAEPNGECGAAFFFTMPIARKPAANTTSRPEPGAPSHDGAGHDAPGHGAPTRDAVHSPG